MSSISQHPATSTNETDALFARFAERLQAVGGEAARAPTSAELARLIAERTEGSRIIYADGTFANAPGLDRELRALGSELVLADDPSAVRDAPVGLTRARLAVAETGSVLLVEPRLAERAVSLMTERLIVICDEALLVPSLDEAGQALREISADSASYATLVTGPSRTADIERQLTVGVQGPGAMHVLFVRNVL